MLSPQTYRARRGFDKWIPSCTMPPLLPSLLANCTSPAKLSLHAEGTQGKQLCPLTCNKVVLHPRCCSMPPGEGLHQHEPPDPA